MSSYEKRNNTKVVDLIEIYNFVITYFFISRGLHGKKFNIQKKFPRGDRLLSMYILILKSPSVRQSVCLK